MTQQTKRRNRALEQAAAALLGGIFTLVCPAAGMQPFGLAFLSVGAHPLFAALGVFFAGLTGGRSGLIYGAAAMVVLACRMVLEGTSTARRKAVSRSSMAGISLPYSHWTDAAADRSSETSPRP